MSRIIYPSDFTQQRTLLENIVAKNTTDPTVLQAFLAQQGITLVADVAAGTAAKNHDDARLLLGRSSQNLRELRDLKLDPVMAQVKNCAQFLKTTFKPNYKELGAWGIPITDSGKITYPSDVVEQAGIFTAIRTKHDSYPPGSSPLQIYITKNNIDLVKSAAAVTSALESNSAFLQAAKDAENDTELRDNLWQPVNAHLHRIGDFLKNLNSDNTKSLGLWGFVVDESALKPKQRTTILKSGEKITINAVVLGSALLNEGATEAHLYKGKSTTGNPIIIPPAESFGILKGYSTLTISNPSPLQAARIKVMVTK